MKNPYNKLIILLIISLSLISCNPSEEAPDDNSNATIWKGATKTFSKANGADPTLPSSQDRLTSNVWITRGNNGGAIYNIAKEDSANGLSPKGTRWAVGTIDNISNLTFQDFRSAVDKPRESIGKNLVMYLVDDNIYLSVKFTSWTQGNGGQGGGFAYERSTP